MLQNSEIGLRLSAAPEAQLQLELFEDSLINLGTGAILQGSLCQVTMQQCQILHSTRIGLHALREASCKLHNCQIAHNGRGVVVASGSNAQIDHCCFEGNIGWALRFEAPEQKQPEDTKTSTSYVIGNEFSASKGNAGRKRVRVDTRTGLKSLTRMHCFFFAAKTCKSRTVNICISNMKDIHRHLPSKWSSIMFSLDTWHTGSPLSRA